MTNSDEQTLKDFRKLLALLEIQRRTLTVAGSSNEIIKSYSQTLAFLKRLSRVQILELHGAAPVSRKPRAPSLVTDFQPLSLSLSEIEDIARNEKTPRKVLEEIAVTRFHVPKGSLRSFQNIEMLREKIIIRIQNERTHKTIDEVARQSGR
jgi:hypothetical protein